MTRVLGEIEAALRRPHQDRHQSGRGRVLRAEVRIRAARRHRPRLAVRHHAGRLQPAGAVRRVLHRADGSKKTPVMIHRAICGSMERFLGVSCSSTTPGTSRCGSRRCRRWSPPSPRTPTTTRAEVTRAGAGGRAARRERPAQREDQLQGPRAFARQGAGAPGRRPQGGGGAHWCRSAGSAGKASR